jgi:hypothetical protein
MKILAVPDTKESIDPIQPLGRISLEDDEGKTFSAGSIFFDEWYKGLVSGLTGILNGEPKVEVQLDSEAEPLIWSYDGKVVQIRYLNETIQIRDLLAFKQELKRSFRELAEQYRSHVNWSKCRELRQLLSWAES